MTMTELLKDDVTPAEEGLLHHDPKPAEKMLAKAQGKVNRCKTVEDCDDLLAKVKSEGEKFNDCMETMKKAAQELNAGTIDKDEFGKKIKPCVQEMKKNCELLSFGNIVGGHKNDLTDEDIKNLHDFISGFAKLVEEKKAELKKSPESEATESFIASCESFKLNLDGATPANEGLFDKVEDPKYLQVKQIKYSKTAKLAKQTIQEAGKLLKKKNFNGAIEKYEEAKNYFKALISQTKQIPDEEITKVVGPVTSSASTTLVAGYPLVIHGKDTVKTTTAKGPGAAKKNHLKYLQDMIDRCDAYIMKVKNKEDEFTDKNSAKDAKAAAKAAKHNKGGESAEESFTFFDDDDASIFAGLDEE